jgi:hypothetical protein
MTNDSKNTVAICLQKTWPLTAKCSYPYPLSGERATHNQTAEPQIISSLRHPWIWGRRGSKARETPAFISGKPPTVPHFPKGGIEIMSTKQELLQKLFHIGGRIEANSKTVEVLQAIIDRDKARFEELKQQLATIQNDK